ncbi:MAG: O-antigen ligase family protein [Pseudomonadota bacterium]
MIFAAALLLLAASLLAGDAYRWGAIALLVAACAPWRALPTGTVTVILAFYCGWLLVNALFVTPAYSAESLYRPVILFAAFAAFASLGREATVRLFRAGTAVMAALVLLGLLQHFAGYWHLDRNPLRAAGTFITPNTFATAINLFLLPLAAVYLSGDRSTKVFALALWLFAGLVASQSRGGMLAMFAGLAFVAPCLGRDRLRAAAKPAARLLAGGAAVWVGVVALGRVTVPWVHGDAVEVPSIDAWVGRTFWDRGEIYAATLQLILERPWLGAGANMFWPLFEPLRPAVFGESTFLFAHNDYLQIWLEFGLPGLLLLLGLAAAALFTARGAWRGDPGDPLPLACGAALASCFAHAFVDFPFYVPFVLFVAGAMLGALAQARGRGEALRMGRPEASAWAGTPVRAALALAALVLLAQPMLAQMATRHAVAVMSRGDVEAGLYWQSVARRLEPRNPVHYWAEAVIWRQLASESGDRSQWARADRLLAEGIRANPPHSFTITLDRARMHRLHADALADAAAPREILAWVESAVARAPTSVAGQSELARALAFAGRKEEARRIERALRARQPDHPLVRTLAEEIK